jgi:hypothetical protein
VRTVQGHKQVRTVAVSSAADLTDWESYLEAATAYEHPEATLWACLIRELAPGTQPVAEAQALVSTGAWPTGVAALQAFRPRWHIENDAYRELKEGWGREEQRWGRDEAAVRGRLALTCLAFNTAQVYRTRAGGRLASQAIRRLRQAARPPLGAAPVVVSVAGCYAVLTLEHLLALVGAPVRESLRPVLAPPAPAPT